MSEFERKIANEQTKQDRKRLRREKLASYLYDISKLTFAALVLGGLTPMLLTNGINDNWFTIIFGALTTFFSALIADRILKY